MQFRLRVFLTATIIGMNAFCSPRALAVDLARKAAIEAELPKITANIGANPSNPQLYFSRACMYRVLEKWELAYNDYNDAIEKKIRDWQDQAFEGRGVCRMHLGHYKEALEDFNYALKLNSRLFEARKDRAMLLQRMGYPGKARDEISGLLALPAYKDNPALLMMRAKCLTSLKQYNEALTDTNACLAVSKDNPEALQERARIYIVLKQPQKAITELTGLIAKSPQKGALWGSLAQAYYGMGDYKQTVLNGNKAIELGYENGDLLTACADSYARLGQHQHCVSLASSAIGVSPSSGQPYYLRGMSWRHLQRNDLADADLKMAASLGYKPSK